MEDEGRPRWRDQAAATSFMFATTHNALVHACTGTQHRKLFTKKSFLFDFRCQKMRVYLLHFLLHCPIPA